MHATTLHSLSTMQSQTPRALSSILSIPRLTHRQLPQTRTRTLSILSLTPRASPPSVSRSRQQQPQPQQCHIRSLHSTPSARKGITPDSADPTPPKPESNSNVAGGSVHVTVASPLSEEQYREYAEDYFNLLQTRLEEMQEEGIDIEAEYSVCHTQPSPPPHYLTALSNYLYKGWRPKHHRPQHRHLRPQQATPQQTNLAQLTRLRAEAIRLGYQGG